MSRIRRVRSDIFAILALFGLALLWFAPVLLPPLLGKTLLPFDNLYAFAPWRSLQPGLIPHNGLLSDLVLENAVWKLHIRNAFADHQLPLWNPQIFTGLPFLAAGQSSVFYPLSLLFYILPLELAYGWFTALQIGLAGANMYIFARVLRLRIPAALFSGIVFMFSGFLIASVVFTMFIAAVVWLPLLLAVIEWMIRKQEEKGATSYSPIPYVVVGALIVGVMILAGHPELIYYTLLVASAYSVVRLLAAWRVIGRTKTKERISENFANQGNSSGVRSSFFVLLRLAIWLLVMVFLGVALGAIQLIPLLELVPMNFRQGSASLAQVREWAWPSRHILTFALPNIFGSPSHHGWFDIWTRQWTPAAVNALGEPIDTVFWGIKNYVEGGNYLGVVTWVLAGVAVLRAACCLLREVGWQPGNSVDADQIHNSQFTIHKSQVSPRPIHTWFFTSLAALSLLFAFGTPLYAILFYGLPGWDQLHSPFRWVFPFTVSMAVLGGLGLNVLLGFGGEERGARGGSSDGPVTNGSSKVRGSLFDLRSLLFALLAPAGILVIALLTASVVNPSPFITFGQRVVDGSDLAQMAFADGRMFWSYQAADLLHFGLIALLGGLILWWLARRRTVTLSPPHLVTLSLLALLVLDLWLAHGRFNPASDVALSPLSDGGVPPVVRFINPREGGENCQLSIVDCELSIDGPWRYTTFDMPGEKTFNANVGMYYGWQDVRGYDSIIPRQYVDFMERIAPQENELLYNRIAPLYSNVTGDPYALLDHPLLNLLNVKYLLTEHFVPDPQWQEIYRDETIGVYENRDVMPRVFLVPEARVVLAEEQPLNETDLRDVVFIEEAPADENALVRASPQVADARISRYTANDVFVDVNLSDRGWLVLTDAYFPGWKAFIRPFGSDESQEQELTIHRADSAFRAVYLPDDGQWTIRFVYSPMSFKLGIYVTFLAMMILAFLMLYWMWGRFYRPESTEGDVRTVAKNSVVPLTLNLGNKAIDFAFAMLYVRILGPEGTGKYYFVVALYGFFEIISRYGLGTMLTRDVAADKNQSSRYLTNVLVLRTLLWLVTMPVLALVTWFYANIGTRGLLDVQNIGTQEVQAIAILGVAMIFANWADALSSSFHAFEKMEYPAGLSSIIALLKVTLGAPCLLLGWGFVGLAAVALVVNIIQVIWLYLLLRDHALQAPMALGLAPAGLDVPQQWPADDQPSAGHHLLAHRRLDSAPAGGRSRRWSL